MSGDHARLLDLAQSAALAGGAAIMEVAGGGFAVRRKADQSPVTQADERAEAIILERLGAAAPGIPVIAEERAAAFGLPGAAPERFWLVDPLDGTKEFIRGSDEFTVNVALVERGVPVLGVVYAPARALLYAAAQGKATCRRGGAAPEPIAARPAPPSGAVVVHSRSHADEERLAAFAATLAQAERRVCGSSIKFCLIAAGDADLYPRFGRTSEWDTAAGQAVLEAAGGSVTTLDGARLGYGKPGFLNPDFIARGRAAG